MMLEAAHATPLARRQLPPADAARLADEIAEVASHVDAATHRLLTLIRRFDEGGGPRPPLARADALVAVAEAYLAGAPQAAPVELVVHVDEAALPEDTREADPVDARATLDDGKSLSVATAQRLACDAKVVRVADDVSGNVRPLGRRTRRISPLLRRALRVRDGGCRFPGCTNRITDAHHVVAWSRGGTTTLANLCSLCRRHHRVVHEHGYRIEGTHEGVPRFLRADGSLLPEADVRPAPLPLDAFERLRDLHSEQGLTIDATTAFPRWDGEPADYDLIVHGLVEPAMLIERGAGCSSQLTREPAPGLCSRSVGTR